MSEYGRLWEQVKTIRQSLKELMPDAKLDTLASARVEIGRQEQEWRIEAERRSQKLAMLLCDWQAIEGEMQRTE
jgi:hypothetical protein